MSATIKVDIRQLPHAEGMALPAYQSADAAGMDLLAAVPAEAPLILPPGKYAVVPTGLTIALPPGFEAQVRPRSGLAAKHGITVLNSPGTVDADYRGEINVLLINHGAEPFPVRRGERIAQMVIAPVAQAQLIPVTSLSVTGRGSGGFGFCSFTQLPAPGAPGALPLRSFALKNKMYRTCTRTVHLNS